MRSLAPLLCLALAACAVGPDFRRPSPPAVAGYVPEPAPAGTAAAAGPGGDAQRFLAGRDVPADWWTVFGSAELDALVAEALRANPTVAGAQATLREARENLAAQRGAYFPALGLGAGASRNKNAVDVLSPTLSSGAALYNLYTAQVSVGYALDVFGANRRAVEAAGASAEASRWQLEATYLTVAGNVVTAAIQLAGLDEQVAATEQAIAAEREMLGILRHQLELGAVAGLEVAAQETALAQTETALPPLRLKREATLHLLAVLTGRLPSQAHAPTLALESLRLPTEIPLGVPSELVTRRPDVRAAEANLHVATATVGVNVANLLPQLSIGASLGSSATTAGALLKPYTQFWSAGASLSQTLFEGGMLVHRVRAAEAALDAAGAAYRSTVLGAFQNVADALRALEADAQTLAAAERAAAAAERSLAIVRRQRELGGVSYLALLNAEQSDAQALAARAAARAARYADTAALYQALAGPVPAAAGAGRQP
jgi:NodT family efflux transporter outer membrane factor (OMF) lipoprotein